MSKVYISEMMFIKYWVVHNTEAEYAIAKCDGGVCNFSGAKGKYSIY